jgi:hypothetical protein
MEPDLATLAATGATTLTGLMVTDAWTSVRDRLGQLFSSGGDPRRGTAELEFLRNGLITARDSGDAVSAAEVLLELRAWLLQLLQDDPVAGPELLRLLSARLGNAQDAPLTVHNVVSGGTQYGPVVQGGRVTGSFSGTSPGDAPT